MNISFARFAPRLVRFFIAGAIGCLLAASACAKDDGTDTSYTDEKDIQKFVINADGSYVSTFEISTLINEERAIASIAQQSLSYNKSREKIEIVTAYTQKADGRRVEVKPDQIKDQQENQSVGAPMFQDMRLKVIIFPEVAVGDRIVYVYKRICSTPMFPGHFEDTTPAELCLVKQVTLIYELPANVPLYADNRGFAETPPVLSNGRKTYRWDYVQGENARIESGTVAYMDYGRRLFVSTFPDYAAMAHAYDARAKDKSMSDKKITALAQQVTQGLNEPRAKALAIGNWVRKNIRYVAVYIGAGGVVPHPADTVLDNLYGDCKDHVALVEAMLSAVGIPSTPALINAGNSYLLPTVPMIFNHVITYIPSLDLYMDTTAADMAAKFLPDVDLDKSVLFSHSGKIGHTPLDQPFKLDTHTEYWVGLNGTADFSEVQNFSGSIAEALRYSISVASQQDKDQRVKNTLVGKGHSGSGTYELGRIDEANDGVEIKMKGQDTSFVDLPGPVGIASASSLSGNLAGAMSGMSNEGSRTQDYVCYSRNMDDEARYIVAGDINILAVPRPVAIHDAFLDYQSSYTLKGQTVIVKRHLNFHHTGAVCRAADFDIMSPTINAISRDLRAQIILQSKLQ